MTSDLKIFTDGHDHLKKLMYFTCFRLIIAVFSRRILTYTKKRSGHFLQNY